MTYAELLKHPKWQRRRLQILERDGFACKVCGDTETELHIHHKKYKGKPWEADDDDMVTTCKICHFIFEMLKREWSNCSIASLTRLPSVNSKIYCASLIDKDSGRSGLVIYQYFNDQLISNVALNQNCLIELKSILNTNKNV